MAEELTLNQKEDILSTFQSTITVVNVQGPVRQKDLDWLLKGPRFGALRWCEWGRRRFGLFLGGSFWCENRSESVHVALLGLCPLDLG